MWRVWPVAFDIALPAGIIKFPRNVVSVAISTFSGLLTSQTRVIHDFLVGF